LKKISPFLFKRFAIHHDRCAMKVGTDAVLLGCWADVGKAKTILDVGTGSGVIALMLAQRTAPEVMIDAIDVEADDAAQAKENALRSPWPNKVHVAHQSIQEFDPGIAYDLIVSNPPYFTGSLLPPSHHRARTRHTQQLTYEELIVHSIRLLNPSGGLAVVLPVAEGNQFKALAAANGLFVNRQLALYTRKDKPQERWLFEFGLSDGAVRDEQLVLYETPPEKSERYIRLTRDFYL
jgi:tRNA1Val (adenine37-N6)-methyltransferase